MKTKDKENLVAQILEKETCIKFANSKKKISSWGQVDNFCQISPNKFIFLEVEASQKHPNTNVSKLWPYLGENEDISIFLIQAFFPNSPGLFSSRGNLCEFISQKIKKEFNSRYFYKKIIIENGLILEKQELIDAINQFKKMA